MSVKDLCIKIIRNRNRIAAHLCFWGMLCFNLLCLSLTIYTMFTYDGGTEDAKVYYEIRDINMAHDTFSGFMLREYLLGLLFAFPLLISLLFVRKITLNAVMLQLLPILVMLGQIVFFD
ncbi:MAG: hypothetical protein IKN71_00770 [Alphaproteobacteria bacterium]|nr:hypothetical protein [Alphaproteobacteria bacterium]